MNPHNGRDHWIEAYSDMFLGGGVKPGRVIGKTDEVGAKVIDKALEVQRTADDGSRGFDRLLGPRHRFQQENRKYAVGTRV